MEEFELEPGETITLSVRKHWIMIVGQLISYGIAAILPLFFPLVISLLENKNTSISLNISKELSGSGPWIQLFYAFWLLYLTVWIITTTRIVEIHQYGFFSRRVSSFLLNRVQDVTTNVEGFLATVFGYGALDVETAGKDEKFGMYGIRDPEKIRDLIMREVAALHADGQLPQAGV
jgi:uncharacterized membrane protein YdbT with pleckstrin-like domain